MTSGPPAAQYEHEDEPSPHAGNGASEARGEHPRPRRLLRYAKGSHVGLAALLALIASIFNLWYTLRPADKPDPRDDVSGEVSVFAVEPDVSVGAWIDRAFPDPTEKAVMTQRVLGRHPQPSERRFRGELIYVRTAVTGFKRRKVVLGLSVYDARTNERISRDRLGGPEIPPLAVDAPSQRSVTLLWIPSLTEDRSGRHFVRVELYDERTRKILAVGDSSLLLAGRERPKA